jgi:hypothetical protein
MADLESGVTDAMPLKEKLKKDYLTKEQTRLYDCSNCVEKVTGVGGTACLGCSGPEGIPYD